MKLVTLSGGLGNQMFQYAFFHALCAQGQRAFLYKNKIQRYREHGGYELERLFGIEQHCPGMFLTRMLTWPLVGKALKHILFPRKIRERRLYDFEEYASRMSHVEPFFCGTHWVGYWQSERYFQAVEQDIRAAFAFKTERMNEATRRCAEEMAKEKAVSLHVRRGDYVNTPFCEMYGDVADEAYYRRAIDYVCAQIPDAVFYVFSDDLEWVKAHLPLPSRVKWVDWNRGRDSWQDMYLMSCCRGHVLANSSFSWWGAYLDARPDSLVVAPKLWVRHIEAPDVTPPHWVRL